MSAGAAMAGFQIVGTLLGGVEANAAARRDARVLDENARLTRLAGEENIAAVIREERQVSGSAIAAMAGSATAVGTGTSADIIMQNAVEREIEIGNLRAQAEGEARNFEQGAMDRRAEGRSALFNSLFAAAGAGLESHVALEARRTRQAADAADHQSRLPRRATKTGRAGVVSGTSAAPTTTTRDPLTIRSRFGVLSRPGGY